MPLIDLAEMQKASWKPADFDKDSISLSSLYEDKASKMVMNHLITLGVGNPKNKRPIVPNILRRLIEQLAVTYSVPAVRRLRVDGEDLPDDDKRSVSMSSVLEKMNIDLVWRSVDQLRALHRQVVVSWVESSAHKCVQARVFAPHNVLRKPNPRAPDILDEDQAVALMLKAGTNPEDQIWELWQREDDVWLMHVVDGVGDLTGTQPYEDTGGEPPFKGLPAQIVYDELPMGRAWLPLGESRIAYALNIAAVVADLQYLIHQEGHTAGVHKTDNPETTPKNLGPGAFASIDKDDEIEMLALSPKINECGVALDQFLRLWATGESLPADNFAAKRNVLSGQALRVQERPLEARRQRQIPMMQPDESRAFEKIRAVHNAHADGWGLPELPDGADLSVAAGRAWQPVDLKELQEASYKDTAFGASSIIDYLQARDNSSRPAAIRMYARVQEDREAYPVQNQQNPLALIDGDGPNVASGPGGATKNPDAFNPDIGTSTEGASVLDAARKAIAPGSA